MPEPRFSQLRCRNLVSSEHEPDIHIEPVSHQIAECRLQSCTPFAAGQKGCVVTKRQWSDGEFDPLLSLECSRPDRGASAELCVAAGKAGLDPLRYVHPDTDKFPKPEGNLEMIAKKLREPFRPIDLMSKGCGVSKLRHVDRGRLTICPASQADPRHGRGHGPNATALGALDLNGRVRIRPRPIEKRDHAMLKHIDEVDERGVADLAHVGTGKPALRQAIQHPARQIKRHRTFWAEQTDRGHRYPGGRCFGGRLEPCDVLHGKTQPYVLPEPGWFPLRWACLPEDPVCVFEPPQELKKVELLGGSDGVILQIRKRLPGVIGHSTSSCFCRIRALVRTNPLIAA
ncbi:UNVERIFIED_ORG: hypothetical protein GGD47_000176 [Rhizobium etli]